MQPFGAGGSSLMVPLLRSPSDQGKGVLGMKKVGQRARCEESEPNEAIGHPREIRTSVQLVIPHGDAPCALVGDGGIARSPKVSARYPEFVAGYLVVVGSTRGH